MNLPAAPANLRFEAGTIFWRLAGDHPEQYEIGIDPSTVHDGRATAQLKFRDKIPFGFGTLMQMYSPDNYRGKRVRMSSYVRVQNVQNWAGLWMRVDGAYDGRGTVASFDNMQDRPIRGTRDWQKYEIVLDVPEDSVALAFGILLFGTGSVWMDEVQFEIVSKDVPTTNPIK